MYHQAYTSQALRNTKLLAAYTMIDSRVPELGCALKRLAKVWCIRTYCSVDYVRRVRISPPVMRCM